MPVHRVVSHGKTVGYRYSHPGHGHKLYHSKAAAMRQARAIGINKAKAHGKYIPKKQ
jgi:hypothetical protein